MFPVLPSSNLSGQLPWLSYPAICAVLRVDIPCFRAMENPGWLLLCESRALSTPWRPALSVGCFALQNRDALLRRSWCSSLGRSGQSKIQEESISIGLDSCPKLVFLNKNQNSISIHTQLLRMIPKKLKFLNLSFFYLSELYIIHSWILKTLHCFWSF